MDVANFLLDDILGFGHNVVSLMKALNCGAITGTGIGAADIQMLLVVSAVQLNREQKAFFIGQALVNKASITTKYKLMGTSIAEKSKSVFIRFTSRPNH